MSLEDSGAISGNVQVHLPRSQNQLDDAPIMTWDGDAGAPSVTFHKSADCYQIRVEDHADFTISRDGQSCSCRPVATLDGETQNHLIRTIVLPFAQSLQGQTILHASCVELNGHALAFLGNSGTGKSTLAAKLTSGLCHFLTDDCLRVQQSDAGYIAHPGEPSIRVWDNSFSELFDPGVMIAPPVSYTDKSRVPITVKEFVCQTPCPLTALFILEDSHSDQISIQPLRGGDAHAACSQHSFLIDPDDPEILTASFHRIANLVAHIPCFRLRFPRDFDLLDDLETAILAQAIAMERAA